MATFHATMMHGKRGGEGSYTFEGEDNLLELTPVRIMRVFMEGVVAKKQIGHVDYLINAALKNDQHSVVTVLGEIKLNDGDWQPYMCMISN
ncbi:MAG: hypothetical protein AAFW47_01460 [Pseudomonadota bacterium]